MADSTTLADKEKDRDRENAYEGLSTALAQNYASYSKRHASFFPVYSTKPGHEYYRILGPYFLKDVPEAVQVALLKAQHENVAPYACTREALSWPKSFGWPLGTKSEWPQWVDRLKSKYSDNWNRAGIYEAIGIVGKEVPP